MVIIPYYFLKLHLIGHKHAGISAVADNVADEGRGDGGVKGGAGEEDGFDVGHEHAVHVGNGFFVFKIAYVADAAEDVLCTCLFAEVDGEALVAAYFNGGHVFKYFFYPAGSLLYGEHGLLAGVDAYADNELIEQGCGAMNNIDMAECDGIEGAGK